jgi:histidinol-phosphate aminotransferase
VPSYRPDLESIPTYTPGKPIDEVSRELGITEIAKLASNECPVEPFPEVQQAIAAAAADVHRYPDTGGYHLVNALAKRLGVEPDNVWLGAGSSQLLGCAALAVGGPGTSAVFADPSFVMYPIGTMISGAEPVQVPLDAAWRHDLDAMLGAIRDDTTLVYVCNPNNPTGTYRTATDVDAFIDAVPERVLVIVDEAYHEYVTTDDHRSAIGHAVARDNVVVMRTFSKVYGLAGLRIGYAVGTPATLEALRRTQPPFSANTLAQVAALEAMRHEELLAERVAQNDRGRRQLSAGLAARGIEHAPSQSNFVALWTSDDPGEVADRLLQLGVIVRRLGSMLRVSVGTEAENARFLEALDEIGVKL